MNFIILDIIFLVAFLLFAGIFLYRNRKNLQQDGWLLLYKTKWGMKLIERTGKKYKKTLKILSYVSVIVGIILMISVFLLMIQTLYLYLTTSVAKVIKAPPLMPLIPYFPQIFNVESIFPPFYFIYFIISILIVATFHEFFHGIFAARYKVRIKSTGFAFLKYFPAFFGAFVEQDDKQMNKKTKFEQMSILSAGVFANILITIISGVILILFFFIAFTPSGIMFNTYSYSVVNISSVDSINNISVLNPSYEEIINLFGNKTITEISANKTEYVGIKGFTDDKNYIGLYDNSPALKSNLSNIIYSINDIKIDSKEKLAEEFKNYKPGDEINITTIINSKYVNQKIILEADPQNKSKAWIGIGFLENSPNGITGKIVQTFSSFKDQNVYYKPNWIFSKFIYDLFWWIILINFAVALFNMLPLGILDGGKFFYLGILSVTKSEKFAEKSFKYITYFLLLIFLALMIKWAFSFVF